MSAGRLMSGRGSCAVSWTVSRASNNIVYLNDSLRSRGTSKPARSLNSAWTHGHEISRWVEEIPTSASWLNLVERWFGDLSGKAVRRGSFASVCYVSR